MDISDTLAPNSDQFDACDLTAGPRVFTVKSVSKGDPEQPVNVHLVEFPRGPWRPGKNMRRVLAACWGADTSAWVGRQVELYCDPTVVFGREAIGGTRIRSLSDINGQQKIPLIVSRGKSAVYTVQPLKIALDAPEADDSVEPNPTSLREGETAFGANNPSTEGGAPSTQEGPESEAPAPTESLRACINRQVREIQAEDGGAFLASWCASQGVAQTSGALADHFGERARNLRSLMAEEVTA